MENHPSKEDDATTSDVSCEMDPSLPSDRPDSQSNHLNNGSTDALAKALSSVLVSLIKDFDSKSQNTLDSQEQLDSALDRLTRELDQLLEDAPLQFIMQHAAKISSVRKRVSSLNAVLKSIQRRVDNIDRMLQTSTLQDQIDDPAHLSVPKRLSNQCLTFSERPKDELSIREDCQRKFVIISASHFVMLVFTF